MSEHLHELIERWKSQGVGLVPAATEIEVRETFRALGFDATADVIALYTSVGGMREFDSELWRLWSLDEIKSENVERSASGVLFSDYLIASWCFRLKANLDGSSAVLMERFDGCEPAVVAGSLDEFFGSYAKGATALIDPGSTAPTRP